VPIVGWRVAMQVVLLALACIGVWRQRRRADVVLLLAGVVVAIVAVHWQVSMLFPRYLYPVMPLVLMLAAAAFAVPPEREPPRPSPRRGS